MRTTRWMWIVLVGACSASASKQPDGGAGGDGGGSGVDLGGGTWQVERVSNTPNTISHTPSLAFLGDGTGIAAWAEPDVTNVSDEDIVTATKPSGGAWSSADPRTNDTNVQNAYARLAAAVGVAHLVWGGYPGGDNDLFYSRFDGSAWTPRADLTTPFETSAALRRDDRIPSLAIAPAGNLAIAYSSSATDSSGNPMGAFEVRVLELDSSGAVTGSPQTVIAAPTNGSCGASAIVYDSFSKLHVVADCGPDFDEDLYYATNSSGVWTSMVVPGGSGRDDYGAQLALDPDGKTIHLAWNAFTACSSGSGSCADILYRKIEGSGTFDPEIHVTSTGDASEMSPALGVDRQGRPLIAYNLANASNFFDVFVTWSEDAGATWKAARNLTPNTDMQDDTQPTTVVFHPKTGLPHVIFYSTIATTPDVNSEIMHAELVP